MRTSRWLAGALALGLVGSILTIDGATVATAAKQQDDDRRGGAAALAALGERINQIAARMGLTVPQLVKQFLNDPTLRIDALDQVVFVDPPHDLADQAETAPAGAPASIAAADAFALHSLPGAQRVIYLDFDGHTVTNTAWNSSTGGSCYAEPYDTDGSPTTFSDSERAAVIGVWQRVAEDYRPFDIDVTTADPGPDAIRRTSAVDLAYGARALITKSVGLCPNGKTFYSSICSGGCGGVAYVGVYDYSSSNPDYYQPALVFQNGVGAGDKNIAEAASHEVGHNLGLSHDGTSSVGYYQGHGSWAPIMGVGYYKAITQWSKGEYTGANQPQDDFVVMQSRGAPLRLDDHANTIAGATPLSADLATNAASAAGVISTRTDKDLFVQTVDQGTFSVTASPAAKSPDLDIRLELLTATGALVAWSDPVSGSTSGDTATGLGASISAVVPAGTYVLSVDGVAYGSALTTGYSDYASLGEYTLATSWVPVIAPPTTTTTTTTTSTTTTTVAPTTTQPPQTSTSTSTTTTSTTTTTTQPVDPTVMQATVTITTSRSGGKVSAVATTKVTNSADPAAPLHDAKVTGQWHYGTTVVSTKSDNTDSAGISVITQGGRNTPAGTPVKFCVTIVAKTGYRWTSGTVCSNVVSK